MKTGNGIQEKTAGVKSVSIWTEIGLLTKMKLSITVVFSSVMAYAIAAPIFNWVTAVLLIIGGMLITGAANALNQVLERDYDALMERTKLRPLADNRMAVSSAVLIAGLSAVTGTLILTLIHPLAGFLGILSMVLYAFVYTPMKRVGPSAVFVGAIPGALPVLIGAIIGSGELTVLAIILFGIQFFWQIPHFWAIAWMGHEDYTNAGFRLLPNAGNTLHPNIGLHSMIQALFIIPLLVLGAWYADISWLAIGIAGLVTVWYAWKGYQLYVGADKVMARKLMFASFAYLPLVLLIFLVDTIII